jgi:hypothetical protein
MFPVLKENSDEECEMCPDIEKESPLDWLR